MPTYEYECTSCKHRFELFQGIKAAPIEKCPKCNKKVRRLISSGSGIIFKGSGFYATDYRKHTHSSHPKTNPGGCPRDTKEGCDACQHNK